MDLFDNNIFPDINFYRYKSETLKVPLQLKYKVYPNDTIRDIMKKCENKKNKKKTRRLKMRLHDKTIKGILSQTLF